MDNQTSNRCEIDGLLDRKPEIITAPKPARVGKVGAVIVLVAMLITLFA